MELFANGALCLYLRLAHLFRDHTAIIERQSKNCNNHQNSHYHILCVAMFDNFVQTDADKSRDVRNALNSSRQKTV